MVVQKIEAKVDASEKRGNRMILKAYVIGAEPDKPETPPETTKTLSERDAFVSVADRIITPPHNLYTFAQMVEQSAELGQNIEAMEANIEGFGHRLVARVEPESRSKSEQEEIKKERIFLENFFAGVALPSSFTHLRKRRRRDLESTGNGYWEPLRNAESRITAFNPIPSYQMRLGVEDQEFTAVKVPLLVRSGDTWVLEDRLMYRRFRRYVQGQVLGGTRTNQLRWFKAFGDPRTLDAITGEYVDEDKAGELPEDRRANEVIHFRIYSPRTPYGLPRWIGNTLAVLGGRAAEEVNYTTLKNNNVPSLFIPVSGGYLTPETIERIEQFFETTVRGTDNYSKAVVLQAESEFETEGSGQVKIDVKELKGAQHTDALFQEYLNGNRKSLRRAFRIPGLFVGDAEEENRATSDQARRLADEQVFAPERDEFDWFVNNQILPDLGAKWHRFESRTPNVTDNKELIAMLAAIERTGGSTPWISRRVAEDVFPAASEAPPLDPSKFDPHIPFTITVAEKVKNMGGAAGPTEPNQTGPPVQPPAVVKRSWADATVRDWLDAGDRATEEIRRLLKGD
jgi:PBSX family phage portal protein